MKRHPVIAATLVLGLASGLSACSMNNKTVRGAAIGAAGGAVIGAVVPGVSTVEGAAIGAAGGAVVGTIKDKK